MNRSAQGGRGRGAPPQTVSPAAESRLTRRGYLMAAAILGIAAVVAGLLLAAAPATTSPVVAVAAIPGGPPSPGPLRALVARARSDQASVLILVAKTPQLAAATMNALTGYVPPPRVLPEPTPSATPRTGKKHRSPVSPAASASAASQPAAPTAGPASPTAVPTAASPSPVVTAINGPPDVSVVYSPTGTAAVIAQLQPSVEVIDGTGTLLRAGVKPGGRGLLALLWACLLLGFAYLVIRALTAPRTARAPSTAPSQPPTPGEETGAYPRPPPPERTPPGWTPPVPGPDNEDLPAEVSMRAPGVSVPPPDVDLEQLRVSYDILASHQPRTPGGGWQPQCPWCGSFSLRARADPDPGYACLACGSRWETADPGSWPDVVLSHRRQVNPAAPGHPT